MTVATVAGVSVDVAVIDAREARLRAGTHASALPRSGTSEGRQLRRWLTQLVVTEKVIAVEAAALGITGVDAPAEADVLPDVTARLEIGSVAAAALASPLARSLFMVVTADVDIDEGDVADYHRRNPWEFTMLEDVGNGWRTKRSAPAPLSAVGESIAARLRGAARRRHFRQWLDVRRDALVELAPGYEHPGDPRQPDNTHKH